MCDVDNFQSFHHCLKLHTVYFNIYVLFPKMTWKFKNSLATCNPSVLLLCISSLVFKIFPTNKLFLTFKYVLYFLLSNVGLSEMCCSAFCRPFQSIRVSFFTYCSHTRSKIFDFAVLLQTLF